MKKILFLGGAHAQVPIIKEAKSRGHYIITCDYLPDNPGHIFADEYYNISTLDKEAILIIAKECNIDFIVAYATDIAVKTAAYVSESLGLPYNSISSIKLLTEKDHFRKFLVENGLNSPAYVSVAQGEDITTLLKGFVYPIIIKPTDASGSKGVLKIESSKGLNDGFEYALQFSTNKRVIVEEYIDSDIADIHGDAFVVDGKVIFCCLGDHLYNTKSNPFNPVMTIWPSRQPLELIAKLESIVQKVISASGFKSGGINIEARVNSLHELYIMEIAPRNGGNFVPQAIEYCTGFSMIKAQIDIFEGINISIPHTKGLYSAYYVVHSNLQGSLKKINISSDIKSNVKDLYTYKKIGDMVHPFVSSSFAIGILLLQFKTRHKQDYYLKNIDTFVSVDVQQVDDSI